MLQILSQNSQEIRSIPKGLEFESNAIWYDLINPEPDEVCAIEQTLGIHVPSLAEISEIEESSRLFEDKGVLYMAAILIASADSGTTVMVPTTFIVTQKNVVTVRYNELKAFQIFIKKIFRNEFLTSQRLFLGLIDTIVERTADILELNSAEIDMISNEIFKDHRSSDSRELKEILIHIGKTGSLNSKVRESLVTIDRLLNFYSNQLPDTIDKKNLDKVVSLQKDVKSLVNYVSFLFSKIEFLLDATLGFIDIEQNGIIKFFSVAAVIFLPPMVIASVYGMNFALIPELRWVWGYPFALVLMFLSAVLPYYYFKRKGWL